MADHLVQIEQIYGIRTGTLMRMFYGDSSLLQAFINQYYSDCPLISRSQKQPYSDMAVILKASEQPYAILADLQAYIVQKYIIADVVNYGLLNQGYAMLDNNPLMAAIKQIYLLQPDSDLSNVNFSVTVDGDAVKPTHLNIEADLDYYCITGEIHLRELPEFEKGADVVVTINSDVFVLTVESIRRSRPNVAVTVYIIELASPTIKLSSPWSSTIAQEFSENNAKTIVEGLASPYTVTWEILDFPVLANTLYANNEDAITIIRKIVRAIGGVVQSTKDGNLKIIYEYPVAVDKWQDESPVYYLNDAENFISQDETFSHNTGFNKFLVSDQLTAEDNVWPEQSDISENSKTVQLFQTPFDSDTVFSLSHTGGAWVNSPIYNGLVEEELEETIEFVGGYAKTSKPIYGELEVDWIEENLGSITYSEDGSLEAEIKDGTSEGYSLVVIKYTTKSREWLVVDNIPESIQYIVREND